MPISAVICLTSLRNGPFCTRRLVVVCNFLITRSATVPLLKRYLRFLTPVSRMGFSGSVAGVVCEMDLMAADWRVRSVRCCRQKTRRNLCTARRTPPFEFTPLFLFIRLYEHVQNTSLWWKTQKTPFVGCFQTQLVVFRTFRPMHGQVYIYTAACRLSLRPPFQCGHGVWTACAQR